MLRLVCRHAGLDGIVLLATSKSMRRILDRHDGASTDADAMSTGTLVAHGVANTLARARDKTAAAAECARIAQQVCYTTVDLIEAYRALLRASTGTSLRLRPGPPSGGPKWHRFPPRQRLADYAKLFHAHGLLWRLVQLRRNDKRLPAADIADDAARAKAVRALVAYRVGGAFLINGVSLVLRGHSASWVD